MFEAAVDRDLFGTASEPDRAMLAQEPARWKACLTVRHLLIQNALGTDAPAAFVTVDVVETAGVRQFRQRVGALNPKALKALWHDVVLRKQAVKQAARDLVLSDPHRNMDKMVLDALVHRASTYVPRTDAAWWATFEQFMVDFRGGKPPREGRWDEDRGPVNKELRRDWPWLAQRWADTTAAQAEEVAADGYRSER